MYPSIPIYIYNISRGLRSHTKTDYNEYVSIYTNWHLKYDSGTYEFIASVSVCKRRPVCDCRRVHQYM